MKKQPLVLALLACGMIASAHAQTPKQEFTLANKQAATRYADDKKICAGEADASARMQCARDAKSEYNKALATAKTNLKLASAAPAKAGKSNAPVCADCGKVISITEGEKAGDSGAVGVVAGGVAGALLGHQVGGGTGKDLATIAAAAGGAYAGKKIEEKMNTTKFWTVTVQYENGNQGTFTFDKEPPFINGDKVKNAGSSIVRH